MGEQFLPIRDPKEIQDFMETFYSEIGISPRDVEYVEACGSGKSSSLFVKSKSLVLTRSSQTQRNSSARILGSRNSEHVFLQNIFFKCLSFYKYSYKNFNIKMAKI